MRIAGIFSFEEIPAIFIGVMLCGYPVSRYRQSGDMKRGMRASVVPLQRRNGAKNRDLIAVRIVPSSDTVLLEHFEVFRIHTGIVERTGYVMVVQVHARSFSIDW